MELPDNLVTLLRTPALCFVSTLMPSGSPQLTEVWVDTDGEHVLINSVQGHQKVRNVERDPRVAIAITDPENPRAYFQVRGRVIELTTDGAREHVDELSHKYTGAPYSWYGGRDQVRVLLRIEADHITAPHG